MFCPFLFDFALNQPSFFRRQCRSLQSWQKTIGWGVDIKKLIVITTTNHLLTLKSNTMKTQCKI